MGKASRSAGALSLVFFGCIASCGDDGATAREMTNPNEAAGTSSASGTPGGTSAAGGGGRGPVSGMAGATAGARSPQVTPPAPTTAGSNAPIAGSAAGSAASVAGNAAPIAGSAAAAGSAAPVAGSAAPPVAGSGSPPPSATEPKTPEPKAECKPFTTGDMTFAGSRVKIWAGEKKAKTGPLIFYWYATGGSVAEVTRGIPSAAITEITGMGGIIAAMYQTTSKGMNTGNGVWYTGDFDVADEIVGCAVKVHDIDTHHIHALGWSAGGLQSGYMAYARSNYMASVSPYSGGSLNKTLQDPSNVPSAILFHGAPGADVVILDFSQSSDEMGMDLKMKGGFALNCNHGGGHMIPNAPGPAAAWLFFKAHGYKTKPSPWATMIPAGVPMYCKAY